MLLCSAAKITLVVFLENEDNSEKNYQNITNIIVEFIFFCNKHEIFLFLHLISQITKNFYIITVITRMISKKN